MATSTKSFLFRDIEMDFGQDAFLRVQRKKANTSLRLWDKVLACHAAGLPLSQELTVHPAYQMLFSL